MARTGLALDFRRQPSSLGPRLKFVERWSSFGEEVLRATGERTVSASPTLLRRMGRRCFFRRLVFVCALVGMLVAAPSAGGTPPEITVSIFGTLGSNGWYRSNVTVNWTVLGAETSTGCDAKTLTADTLGTKLTCTAVNGGDETIKSVTIKLDKTPPAAGAAPDRPPDANGWYNRALTVAFSGTDATSGIANCSSTPYSGPDGAAVVIAGSCQDLAGNVSSGSYTFKYDATAPTLFSVSATLGNRSAQVAWRKSADTQLVEVLRAPGRDGAGESVIYRGAETGVRDTGLVVGRKYEYRVAGVDEAANRAEQKVGLVATGPLLSPAPAQSVTSPPMLVWTPVRKASYYNVQLYRGGRRVMSAWPDRPSYRLRRTWLYKGRRYRLRPGLYRWYVWPGYGRISDARYPRRPLGGSTFVVAG
jgi:hypothetical protein